MNQNQVDVQTDVDRTLRAVGFVEHLKFFDLNDDQRISIRESQQGLERLGFGHLLSIPGSVAINLGVAGLGLLQGRLVNPLELALPTSAFVRHSDMNLVDDNGDFDQARLDSMFTTYGKELEGVALTLPEIASMLSARVVKDAQSSAKELLMLPVGLTAVAVEWGALVWVAGTMRQGKLVLEKETVRRFYTDPRFFHDVAHRIAEQRAARSQTALGVARNRLQSWLL